MKGGRRTALIGVLLGLACGCRSPRVRHDAMDRDPAEVRREREAVAAAHFVGFLISVVTGCPWENRDPWDPY